ncbi:hypothetical protein GCM10027258_93280 [Amycolatopsis stemonae]
MIEFGEVVGVPRSDADQAPVSYVSSGTWPEAMLADDAPVSAHFGLAFAQRLYAALAISGMSGRAAAAAAGLSHATVQRVLRGEVLPDLGTLARLEVALSADLYPVGLRSQFSSVNPR